MAELVKENKVKENKVTEDKGRLQALERALGQIEKTFGSGSIMRDSCRGIAGSWSDWRRRASFR